MTGQGACSINLSATPPAISDMRRGCVEDPRTIKTASISAASCAILAHGVAVAHVDADAQPRKPAERRRLFGHVGRELAAELAHPRLGSVALGRDVEELKGRVGQALREACRALEGVSAGFGEVGSDEDRQSGLHGSPRNVWVAA